MTTMDDIDILKSALADKMLGNELRISATSATGISDLVEIAIKQLADSLADAAIRRGMVIVPGSSRAIVVKDHWLNDSVTIAGKLRAIVSERPEALVCMATYQAQEAREDAARQRIAADNWRDKYVALLEQVSGCRNLAALRRYIRQEQDDKEL